MGSIVDRLMKRQLITPPSFMKNNIHYEVMMGSVAYGVSSDDSDVDLYGFCIPPKTMIFPHLAGEILGFGRQKKRFEQYQQHHVLDPSNGKEYDFSIYSIIKFFQLCMDNNPNMIDSLFVPRRCVLHSTQVGEHVRENRKLFLHKGSYWKCKGYSFSQIHKLKTKKHYLKGKFKNIVTTDVNSKDNEGFWSLLKKRSKFEKVRYPHKPIKTKKFDKKGISGLMIEKRNLNEIIDLAKSYETQAKSIPASVLNSFEFGAGKRSDDFETDNIDFNYIFK